MKYLMKNGYHQALLIKNQKDVQLILKDPNIDASAKKKVQLIMKTKEFGEKHLGLSQTNNYTTYVQLDRPFVTYLLQVSYPMELKYHEWKFPILGRMPYKGFFIPEDARSEAKNFQNNGYDT
jgi:predicted aminopeptidase